VKSAVLSLMIGVASLIGCAKPEPEPTSVREPVATAPAVAAPELEEIDPLEAARAESKQRGQGDASWRVGFDNRAGDAAEPEAGEPSPELAEQPSPAGAAGELTHSTPPPELEPTHVDPLPSIGGLPPRDPEAVAKRPADAMPPGH
jgi:hypothetical protein